MGHYVNNDLIQMARNADLYHYLITYHPSEVLREGNNYIHLKEHDSLYVKRGSSKYYRYSDGDTGNAIDFLINYLGYSFSDAVMELCGNPVLSRDTIDPEVPELDQGKDISCPQPGPAPYKRVYAYLTRTRGLCPDVVTHLFKKGLLYQDLSSNAVFINHDRSFYEIRGTCSDIKYHRSARISSGVPYWSIKVGHGKVSQAYICEGSIDAISLYELQRIEHVIKGTTLYCSIGGIAKQKAIDCIAKLENATVTLAVDNDSAGEQCRRANPELQAIVPSEKDWNDDLKMKKKMIAQD